MPVHFDIRFDPVAVEHLRQRVRTTQWAPERQAAAWEFGVPGVELRRLASHWADGFDFGAAELALNRLPNFRANVEGIDLHFVHRRGVGPSPIPLVLTHGWPWTFWDYAKVIEPLADPERFGGDAGDAFDVIVPALPGFPFSAPLCVRCIVGSIFSQGDQEGQLWKSLMSGKILSEGALIIADRWRRITRTSFIGPKCRGEAISRQARSRSY